MIRNGVALRAQSIAYLTGATEAGPRPAAVGQKFDEGGAVLGYPGNTFICHIPPQSDAHRALSEASAALQAGPLAGAFSFLPPSSFHMTVFEGITDAARHDARWPEGIAPETPIAEVTRRFAERAVRLSLPVQQMIRPTGIFAGFSVSVTGATPEAERSLRDSRAALREATGIRRPDFDRYGFHITLAYLLRWLTRDEAEAVVDLSERVFARLSERAPGITLGPVEFCSFKDMHAFWPSLSIGAGQG